MKLMNSSDQTKAIDSDLASIKDDRLQRIAGYFDRLRPLTLRVPEPGSFIRYPYGVPSGFYQQLWDRDGFFINLHLANRDGDFSYCRFWVQNFVHAYQELGHPPGCVTLQRPETGNRGFPLKPFMAQSALLGSWNNAEHRTRKSLSQAKSDLNRHTFF